MAGFGANAVFSMLWLFAKTDPNWMSLAKAKPSRATRIPIAGSRAADPGRRDARGVRREDGTTHASGAAIGNEPSGLRSPVRVC